MPWRSIPRLLPQGPPLPIAKLVRFEHLWRMLEPAEVFEGRCQCGSVRYRVAGRSVAFFICHCGECQRQSASAFGLALWIQGYRKDILAGEARSWTRKTPTGRSLVGELCARCGTRLFHQMAAQAEIMSIKPGTLDEPLALAPVAQIWTSRAARWLELPGMLSYPENPPDFEAIFAAWRARKSGRV